MIMPYGCAVGVSVWGAHMQRTWANLRCTGANLRCCEGRASMKVLLATKDSEVLNLVKLRAEHERVYALDTRRIYEAIPGTQLAIIDYEDLIAQPFSVEFVRKLLSSAPLRQCSSSEFLAAPQSYLETNEPAPSSFDLLPKRTIAVVSYAGGTGKTCLALDTALHFAERTSSWLPLPVALMEFTYGGSALAALLGQEQPNLADLVSQRVPEANQFRGVTVYGMDYAQVQGIPVDEMGRYYRSQIANHVLTVIDSVWPHGMLAQIKDSVDMWIILATPRLDAVENARRLYEELAPQYGLDRVLLVTNQMGGLADTLALMGTHRDLELRQTAPQGAFFGGRLGREILRKVYDSMWAPYEGRSRGPHPARGLLAKRGKGKR
jgi:Mrp family chromosome partitioning ATPase